MLKQVLAKVFGGKVAQVGKTGSITIVSGLPRSGTSLMMQALEAGGMLVLTDGIRRPDEDNPRGYYEFERVKQLPKRDYGWLESARGKVVKVVAALLEHLPPGYEYKIIFMHRRMEEILASQRAMLVHRGEAAGSSDDGAIAKAFQHHLEKVQAWLSVQPHIDVLDVDYNALLTDPGPEIHRVNLFLGGWLDEAAMAAAVDARLYRNRLAERDTSPPSAA